MLRYEDDLRRFQQHYGFYDEGFRFLFLCESHGKKAFRLISVNLIIKLKEKIVGVSFEHKTNDMDVYIDVHIFW